MMEEKYLQEEFFRRLEERLLQPDVRKSVQDVADLLADDFVDGKWSFIKAHQQKNRASSQFWVSIP